jgi:hypothetical protein
MAQRSHVILDLFEVVLQQIREFAEDRHWYEMSRFKNDIDFRGFDPMVLGALGSMMSSQ